MFTGWSKLKHDFNVASRQLTLVGISEKQNLRLSRTATVKAHSFEGQARHVIGSHYQVAANYLVF